MFLPRRATSAARVLACGMSIALLGAACRERSSPAEQREAAAVLDAAALAPVQQYYADLAHALYGDSAVAARALERVIDEFLVTPSREGLEKARAHWILARKPYQQSEVYRFYEGPIDEVEKFVNPWPIDENYVEAGAEGGKPGIVEDVATYPELSLGLLTSINTREGETSVSTGYHVLEFLLWGRDTRADGPGDRPYDDYVPSAEEKAGKAPPIAARRGRYLKLATELLVQHLERVRDAWAPNTSDNYRARFLRMPANEAFGLIVKGMGALSGPELAGERLTVPYATKSQENEHSCFSDTTHTDMALDALGIQNVCLGRYARPDGAVLAGPGLCDFIAKQRPELAKMLRADLAASVARAESIPPPFDRAILGSDTAKGRMAVRQAIQAFERQTETLSRIAAAYAVRMSLASPRANR
jgi:putative iron-regulated protein